MKLKRWVSAASAALLLAANALGEADVPVPETVLQVEGYELSCSGLLSGDVAWYPAEDTPEADLVFILGGQEDGATLFTMTMLEDQTDHVKVLTAQDGDLVPVGFTMAAMPENLTDQEQQRFLWAQDEVHLILRTLALRCLPPREIVQEVDPATQLVRIETEWASLTYAGYFADKLAVTEENGTLVFRAGSEESPITVFTICPGSEDGNIVRMLPAPDGRRIPVAFVMTPADELGGEMRSRYYEALGALNEILASIVLK